MDLFDLNETSNGQHDSDSVCRDSHRTSVAPPILFILCNNNVTPVYDEPLVVEVEQVRSPQFTTETESSTDVAATTTIEKKKQRTAEKEKKKRNKQNKSTYQCEVCRKVFNNRQNISRHMIKIHKVRRGREAASKTISCKEEGCRTRPFGRLKELKVHLMQRHEFNFHEDVTEFSTWDDFVVWKKKFETTHSVSFVQHSGSKRWRRKNVVYYYCHKSGDYESQSKGCRNRRSCKVGFSCTATMKVTIDKETQKVVVCSCNDHYGHRV